MRHDGAEAARLEAIVPLDRQRWISWQEQHMVGGDCPSRAFGWLLADARRLDIPLAAPGDLRLFFPHPTTVVEIFRQNGIG